MRRGHRPAGPEVCEMGDGVCQGWRCHGLGIPLAGECSPVALPRELLCAGLSLNSVRSGWESSLLPWISPGASLPLPGAHPRQWVRQYLTYRSFFEFCGPSGAWKLELHHGCWF